MMFENLWSPRRAGVAMGTIGLRASGNSPHAYDNVDWLVGYESEWRSNAR